MKLCCVAAITLLLLAGCGEGEPPAAQPSAKASASPLPEVPVMGREVRIVALGDSLFAGYGLQRGDSYPAKLETALRARGINARIANAGVSGDTSAGGLERLAFTLRSQQQPPELVIISLGGNDLLRGLPPAQTRTNLEAILSELQRREIPAVLQSGNHGEIAKWRQTEAEAVTRDRRPDLWAAHQKG